MIDLKPYYQVKLHLLIYKASFLHNPPKTDNEKYAYDIIQKAYWINEKKIEMLDYKKRNKLVENYCKCFNNTKSKKGSTENEQIFSKIVPL